MTKIYCDECGKECPGYDQDGERFQIKREKSGLIVDVHFSRSHQNPDGSFTSGESDLCRECLVGYLREVKP